jgi:hypothetical protein
MIENDYRLKGSHTLPHFMRVFTASTAAPTIPVLHQQLEQEEFTFDTFPKTDDPRYGAENWRTLHLAYDKNVASVMLDRSVRGDEGDVFGEEIEEFQEALKSVPESAEKTAVQQILQNASQVFACYIPDDMTEEGWELVESLLEKLLDSTEGSLQVDGEGFFDKEGELILSME